MQHLYYESLRRRIGNQHEKFPLIEEKIQRAEAGIYGEMLVTRELSDINLPHFEWIANFQYLSSQNTSYQIDFILIFPHCLVILEVKNITGVHALAYPLGGQFHIAHGDSNAVLLPYVMGYIRKSCEKRMKDIYEAMGFSSSNLSQEEASYKCVAELKRLVEDVGIPSTLQGFDIPESALESLTEDATKQKRILARSPLELGKTEIAAIYRAAFNGEIVE